LNVIENQNFHPPQSLDDLISVLSKEEDYSKFGDIIQATNLPLNTYLDCCSWSKDIYTRNCIFENEKFELILICWEANQSTPIHDHGGEECWVKIVDGSFKETIYKWDQNNKLVDIKSIISTTNDVTYMVDFMGFHRLENLSDKRSLSLHLYAKPIRNCNVFDENSNKFIHKKLSYNIISEMEINFK
jgi:cysteine dioxygenase